MHVGLLAWLPGGTEWIVIAVVGLLIFGRRLPDVARSIGKSIVEFKRGLRDVKEDVEIQSRIEGSPRPKLENNAAATPESGGSSSTADEKPSPTPKA